MTTVDADIRGEDIKLLEPFFGEYQIAFVDGELHKLAVEGHLKNTDISIAPDGHIAVDVTARFINGYVPLYGKEDFYDDRILEGKRRKAKKKQ